MRTAPELRTAAILTAAGSGARLGHALPKAIVPVAGDPIVLHAARRLCAARFDDRPIDSLVVSAPADHVEGFVRLLEGLPVPVTVVAGGPSRQASVAAALAAVPDDVDVVLVHDAARPFAPPALIERVVAAVAAGHEAVVPGLAVTDTIKRVGPTDDAGPAEGWPVLGTVDRATLRAVQTPQGFTRGLLARAHASAADDAADESLAASDDAGLVERLGLPVWVVPGDDDAAKITTRRDLAIAELTVDPSFPTEH